MDRNKPRLASVSNQHNLPLHWFSIKNNSRGVVVVALEQGYAEAEARDSGTEAKVREQSFMGFLHGCTTTSHYSSGIWQSSGA